MTDTDDIRASAEAGVDAPAWRDRKRYWWPLGLLIPLSPFLSWLLVEYLHPRPVLGDRCLDPDSRHPDRRRRSPAQMAAAHRTT